jgi:rhodanese-related sulfurtransferase
MSSASRLLAALRRPGASKSSITPARLSDRLATLQLIDVREPGEWRSEHIAGAVHIPLGQLPQSMSSVDKERPVAVICRTGMRSRRAARILREHSVDAANVTGGMRAWMRAGLPVVRSVPGLAQGPHPRRKRNRG